MTRRAISLMRSMLRVSRGWRGEGGDAEAAFIVTETRRVFRERRGLAAGSAEAEACLLYTSPSPRDQRGSRMPSSA